MAKRKVNWSKNALADLKETLDYYTLQIKSALYSSKLNVAIRAKLNTLDVSIALPQKTSINNLYYFTHKHISVCFEIFDNALRVQLIIDDRRNPELLEKIINPFT
jgi:hypothetical protein